MRIAALIIGIVGSLAGIGGALFALTVGGISGTFGAEGAEMVVGLGWAATVISLVAIVAAALAVVKPMEAGITMIIAGIAGLISISVGYVIGGPLLIIAGILSIIGKKELSVTSTNALNDTEYLNCPYCGEEVKKMAIKCRYCKTTLDPHEGEKDESMLSAGWIIGTILLPIIGLVGGIYGLIKSRRGAGWLLGISIISWTLAIIVWSPFITSNTDEAFYSEGSVTPQEIGANLIEEEASNTIESTPGETDSATLGEKNALKSALNYLSFMSFSYSGLISQLEFEGYTNEEAEYAADNCGADWNEQAALKAENYLESMSFSREGLIAQLEFEGFTRQQAEYGVKAVGY